MKLNKTISAPKKGMNRDAHPTQLTQMEYVFAMNTNTESDSGDIMNLTNECSNRLAVEFPDGYKVIGFQKDLNDNKTYFFLTNPTTKFSSIGYVDDTRTDSINQDTYVDCGDCEDGYAVLQPPLETITQTPTNTYIEILEDTCNGDLNFDINFPIKFIELKDEKLTKNLVWTDFKNPPRKIDLNDINYYKEVGEILCGEDNTEEVCINADRILLQPKFKIPCLKAEAVQTGGNLRKGLYEFLIAYCDGDGNEISEYYSITNPISIFDENNRILDQTELNSRTGYSIRLKAENLDTEYNFYKIVVAETVNLSNNVTHWEVGIFPTSTDTITYSSSSTPNQNNEFDNFVTSRISISIERINEVKTRYEKVKGLVSSNNYLFLWGLIPQKEPNLQPIVNLLGAFGKWQTVIAKEDFYKHPLNTTLYKGYMRGEVQPYGIRLKRDNGTKTPIYPLVARPPKESDIEPVDTDDINVLSINEGINNCIDCEENEEDCRNKVWQFYDTATKDEGFCSDLNSVEAESVEEKITCSIEVDDDEPGDLIIPAPSSPLDIQIFGFYSNLADYIQDNFELITDSDPDNIYYIPYLTPYLLDDYEDLTCTPEIDEDVCDNVRLDVDAGNNNGVSILIDEVFDEVVTEVYKTESEYTTKTIAPEFCYPYRYNNEGGFLVDDAFNNLYLPCNRQFYIREGSFNNVDKTTAQQLLNENSTDVAPIPVTLPYNGGDVITDLYITGFSALVTGSTSSGSFPSATNLHKGVLWYKFSSQNRDQVLLEVTKRTACIGGSSDFSEQINQRFVRVSVFYGNSTVATRSEIVDLDLGEFVLLDFTSNQTVYVSVEPPIVQTLLREPIFLGGIQIGCVDTGGTKFVTVPPCGCFGIKTRDKELNKITLDFEKIHLLKRMFFITDCVYEIPLVSDCEPKPYESGDFAFWQSIIDYPDNEELYNSKVLDIAESDIPVEYREKFEEYFVESTSEGNYTLKDDTDLRCKPIRHYKFPTNHTTSFMGGGVNSPFAETTIFPIGFIIDSELVNSFLDIAVKNNLLTEKERTEIVGYEILKGDNIIQRSIVAKGVVSDMYEYRDTNNNKVLYPNYPLNDLGRDKLHLQQNNSLIAHPRGGDSNNKFAMLSPYLSYYKPTLPTEMFIDGYQYGKARGSFQEVDGHSNWVILGDRSRSLANDLATAEITLETLIQVMNYTSNLEAPWFTFGLSNGTNLAGTIANAIKLAVFLGTLAVSFYVKRAQYRYQWLQTFYNLGSPKNFASYYVTEGYHNSFKKQTNNDENTLRNISTKKYYTNGKYRTTDPITLETYRINNTLREDSVFLVTGTKDIEYPQEFKNYDNNNVNSLSSRTIASEHGCDVNQGREIQTNSAFMYVTLKNYIPDQFGTIDSIQWLTTGHCTNLNNQTVCGDNGFDVKEIVFGGTVYISRDWQHKKLSIFRNHAINLADKLPFAYSLYPNIGKPRFYVDYLTNTEEVSIGRGLFPDIRNDLKFDCATQRSYYNKPSKFYLQYHGMVSYLVESEINCNFRYGGKDITLQYYPLFSDIVEYTQERRRTISTRDRYFYNDVYSKNGQKTPYKIHPSTYSKEIWDKRADSENGTVWSLRDNTENDTTDPWQVFRSSDAFDFPTKYGKLIDMKGVESNMIFARFENQASLYNAVDNLASDSSPVAIVRGTGGIFNERPIDFRVADIGYGGSQNYSMASTPYGDFYVDAMRGKIFQRVGQELLPISEVVGGKPSGMKNWFREHLPFKILKYLPEIDIDNNYKGIGYTIGWDERFDRVFFTKRDYILRRGIETSDFEFNKETNQLFYLTLDEEDEVVKTEVFYNNTTLFQDVSFTIAYKPTEGVWVSYYTFTPDYYVPHFDYFQTGINWQGVGSSMWTHPLNNDSLQVFYGKKEPWIVEVPIQNQNTDKILADVELYFESKRWQNRWDFTQHKGITFNKVVIYNNTNNSGVLNLIEQKSLLDATKYPKTNSNNTQDILYTAKDEKIRFNYFYNRVKKETNNQPPWLKDINNIDKTVNPNAVSFRGKSLLERMKGDSFIVRLTQDKETRYQMILKLLSGKEVIYG